MNGVDKRQRICRVSRDVEGCKGPFVRSQIVAVARR